MLKNNNNDNGTNLVLEVRRVVIPGRGHKEAESAGNVLCLIWVNLYKNSLKAAYLICLLYYIYDNF